MHNFPTTAFKMSSTAIDFRTIPSNLPSLCIPRVFPNIDERRIRNVFQDLNMGEIERVDIIKRTTEKGEKFNRVFIHWKGWNDSDNANQARERLLNGKEIKIVYDDPWFWKISAYRESVSRPRLPVNRPAARISFDSDDDLMPIEQDKMRAEKPDSRHSSDIRNRPRRDNNRRPRHEIIRARSPLRRPRSPKRVHVYEPRSPDCSPPRACDVITNKQDHEE
jgi:hypothetical protein